jgi:hypothetical protein
MFVCKKKKNMEKCLRNKEQIEKLINKNPQKIIDNLLHESIEVYNFLKSQFEVSNVTENYLFQFIYRSFYRIDNAGLTNQFKKEYFNILQEQRQRDDFDFAYILQRLFEIVNHKGQRTFQFSFITKMQNTMNPDKPIFDNEVAKVFRLNKPKIGSTFNEKLDFYLEQQSLIETTYNSFIDDNTLSNVTKLFDDKFPNHNLSDVKRLDFIFWTTGKIIEQLTK